jgi:membrane glycosyltransferase
MEPVTRARRGMRAGANHLQTSSVMPAEARLDMPVQDLQSAPMQSVEPKRDPVGLLLRIAVLGGAALLAALFTYEMHAVLAVGGMTPLKIWMLACFVLSISWISLAFANALVGFIALRTGRGYIVLPPRTEALPRSRTAILIPTYNEDPAMIFGTAIATAEGLAAAGAADKFDIFVLSDSNEADFWVEEEACYCAAIARPAPAARIFYRHRRLNTDRKAGNIAEWVTRFGRAYPNFVIFDADSTMEPETLIGMALAMEENPRIGLLQTVPLLVGGKTLFARLQQFAGRVYGPTMATGLAVWTRAAGNYWGHNAILRTQAFARSAGLPHLKGRAPFGGHILSHDFVEAALMRRAGWEVVIAPTLGGSYEESPPGLIDLAQRDRRWCQGNLQHAKVIGGRGFDFVSRMHFGMGIMSYLASPIWLMFLCAGLLLALQAHFIRPEYFTQEWQLFPTWPVIDYQRATQLFLATMAVLFAPKFLGLFHTLSAGRLRRGAGGSLRATASLVVESVVSALIAPIMMLIQSLAVQNILIGRDSGWGTQRRADGSIPFSEIVRRHRFHTLFGVTLGLSAYLVSPALLAWMSPAILGLVIAIPLSAYTSSRGSGTAWRRLGLLLIPEERDEPSILRSARDAAAEFADFLAGSQRGCLRLSVDPALLAFHRKNLPPRAPDSARTVDGPLVVGTARVMLASSLDEALDALSRAEKLAVFSDPASFDRLAQLPRRHATPLIPASAGGKEPAKDKSAEEIRREAAA